MRDFLKFNIEDCKTQSCKKQVLLKKKYGKFSVFVLGNFSGFVENFSSECANNK